VTTTQHRVVFDDTCLFCQRSIRLLRRLDWLKRFTCIGQSSLTQAPHQATPLLLPASPPSSTTILLNTNDLSQAIHVATVRNRVLQGAQAVRFIALRLPLSAPLACLLFLPGAMIPTTHLYRWISKNRHHLTSCGPNDKCRIPPTPSK
jgi:predicted DCC family thiol-disulfide oxidoreductase YuxK